MESDELSADSDSDSVSDVDSGSDEPDEWSEPGRPPGASKAGGTAVAGRTPSSDAVLRERSPTSLLRLYERAAAGPPVAPSAAHETDEQREAEPDASDRADRASAAVDRLPTSPDAIARPTGLRHRRLRLPALHPGLALDRRAVLGLTVLLLLAVGYAVQHFWLGRPEPVPIPAAVPVASPVSAAHSGADPPASSAAGPSGAVVVVEVAGKVRHPGLRTLPSGSRVSDAVSAAGGPLPETDTTGLNLARLLTDGEQIVVGAPAGQPSPAAAGGPKGPLSLNQATIEQLDALPGVGPTLAERIVHFRQEHGGFRSVDQLRQVSGIGARKFGELRPLLTL
ncbi:ComEA family DNA-binding protein [Saccharothrix sp. ST-888]|uniref:ComEA family DNA-binding protein n=1 Tax=Saccharothrix sp. ST-888 TaxID=1427391 RepID=UPI0009E33099|nr:ComEA family DNA-binding protein [Saccharothrix sp. ST-888]